MDAKKLIADLLEVNYSPLEIRTLLLEGEEQDKYSAEEVEEIKKELDSIDPAPSESTEAAAEYELSEPAGAEVTEGEETDELHKDLKEKTAEEIGEEGSQLTTLGAGQEKLAGSFSFLRTKIKTKNIQSMVSLDKDDKCPSDNIEVVPYESKELKGKTSAQVTNSMYALDRQYIRDHVEYASFFDRDKAESAMSTLLKDYGINSELKEDGKGYFRLFVSKEDGDMLKSKGIISSVEEGVCENCGTKRKNGKCLTCNVSQEITPPAWMKSIEWKDTWKKAINSFEQKSRYAATEADIEAIISAAKNIYRKEVGPISSSIELEAGNSTIPNVMFEEDKKNPVSSSVNNPMKVMSTLLSKVEYTKLTYKVTPDSHVVLASLYGETDSMDGIYKEIANSEFEYTPTTEKVTAGESIFSKKDFLEFVTNHADCLKAINVNQSVDIDFSKSLSSRLVSSGDMSYKIYSSSTGNYLIPFKVLSSQSRNEKLVEFVKQGKNYISVNGYVIKSSSMAKYGYPKFALVSPTIPAFFKDKTSLKATIDSMISLVSRKEEQKVILSAKKAILQAKSHEAMLEKQYTSKFNQLSQKIQTLEDINEESNQVISSLQRRLLSSKGNDPMPKMPEPEKAPIKNILSKFNKLI